jgi:hypothetical protein
MPDVGPVKARTAPEPGHGSTGEARGPAGIDAGWLYHVPPHRQSVSLSQTRKTVSRLDVIALDLEGTLLSNAVSQIPRPGLYEFLEFCRHVVPTLVIYTSVPETKVREVVRNLVAEGSAPAWFQDVTCVDWTGSIKDLRMIKDVPVERALLIDDHEAYVAPDQRGQWLPIATYAAPYPADDRELYRVRQILENLWECRAD